jgi:hypothetical protein
MSLNSPVCVSVISFGVGKELKPMTRTAEQYAPMPSIATISPMQDKGWFHGTFAGLLPDIGICLAADMTMYQRYFKVILLDHRMNPVQVLVADT